MPSLSDDIGLRAAVAIRARAMRIRVLISVVIGVLLWTVAGWDLAPAWLALHCAVLGLLHLEERKALRQGETLRPLVIHVGAVATFTIAALPAWVLWLDNGRLGASMATLLLCGMLIELVTSTLGARRLFWCSATPLIAHLVLVPIVAFGAADPVSGFAAAAGAGLVALYLAVVRRGHQSALVNLERSREDAIQLKIDAEAASRAKTDFLALMSHELRTPMNAVLGAADLLKRTDLDAEQKEHVELLADGGAVLMHILNDVLDLSKIEAGKLAIDPSHVDLHVFLRRCLALWEPRARDKGLDFTLEIAPELPRYAVLDTARLGQIIFNLISNALKFTETGGIVITVEAASRTDRMFDLVVSVRDSGSGISPEVLSRLFSAFEQADQSITRRFGGTGLGLSISQKLAGMMGGAITVFSARGAGSTFRVTLPTPVGDAALVERERAADPEAATGPAPLIRILVAEDNAANQRIIDLFLKPLGGEVIIVEDGQAAVEALEARPFDLVLMDMQMPRMDGLEATRRLRASTGPNSGIPVLALTANVMESQRQACLDAGMTGHVAKPIDSRLLLTAVINAFNDSQRPASCEEVEAA